MEDLELTQEEIALIRNRRNSTAHEGAFTNQIAARPFTQEEMLEWVFTYHDDPSAYPHYTEIREAAKTFARTILRHTPNCPDSQRVIGYIRAAVMWANASVALKGRSL